MLALALTGTNGENETKITSSKSISYSLFDDSNVEIVVKDQNEPIELWIAKDASVPVYPFGLINVLDKMGLFLIQVLFVVLN